MLFRLAYYSTNLIKIDESSSERTPQDYIVRRDAQS
jgi:hypothetical protein